MKGKVIEAMRFGIPCVTSAAGAQGLADAGDFLAVANTPDEFATAVLDLLRDDEAWLHASQASQAVARARFSEQALWSMAEIDIDPSPYPDVQARRARMQSNS